MIKFICFGSGSSGNSYYLCAEDYGIIIDLGLGRRQIKKVFHDYGLTIPNIKAILVTHDHTDHVKSVGALSSEFHIPVFASSQVHSGISRNSFITKKIRSEEVRFLEPESPIQLGPFKITSFKVPHDSAGNNGFFIEQINGPSFCLATDIGHLTDEIIQFASQANYLVIEANYDTTMLKNGPYPEYLKRRIESNTGHLSNTEIAESLSKNLTEKTKRVWLCHLSEENNHPELARITVESAIKKTTDLLEKGLKLEVLRRKVPSGFYELE